jgi:hypothetical protein
MTAPTPEQLHVAYESESRPGEDSYGLDVGHLVMPNGSLIAVWQSDDEMARALVTAYRDEILYPSKGNP